MEKFKSLASSCRNSPLVFVALFMVACGGGGGGPGPIEGRSDTTAPSVIATTPLADAIDVNVDSVVTATFNENILAMSVSNDSMKLEDLNGAIDGEVTFDSSANLATFTPSEPLKLLQEHKATVSAGITDLAGNPLNADYEWYFHIRDGAWGNNAIIPTAPVQFGGRLKIAVSADGSAMVIWTDRPLVGEFVGLWANHYMPGQGWSEPVPIKTETVGGAEAPSISTDSAGNFVAVWLQEGDVWSNRFQTDTGWATAVEIELVDASARDLDLAMNSNGEAIAVWVQNDGGGESVWANQFSFGAGWSNPIPIEMQAATANDPKVAIDDSYEAVVIWENITMSSSTLHSNRYLSGSWQQPQTIPLNGANPLVAITSVALDDAGNCIAVWTQFDGNTEPGANNFVFASESSPLGDWSAPTLLQNINGNSSSLKVVADSFGNAVVVWTQLQSDSESHIWSNRYELTNGWGQPIQIESGTKFASRSNLALDSSGNALALWQYQDGESRVIQANRFRAGVGWQDSEDLFQNMNDDTLFSPQIGIDKFGRGIGVWASFPFSGAPPVLHFNVFN